MVSVLTSVITSEAVKGSSPRRLFERRLRLKSQRPKVTNRKAQAKQTLQKVQQNEPGLCGLSVRATVGVAFLLFFLHDMVLHMKGTETNPFTRGTSQLLRPILEIRGYAWLYHP